MGFILAKYTVFSSFRVKVGTELLYTKEHKMELIIKKHNKISSRYFLYGGFTFAPFCAFATG